MCVCVHERRSICLHVCFIIYVCMFNSHFGLYIYMCVCVCVCERDRERESGVCH